MAVDRSTRVNRRAGYTLLSTESSFIETSYRITREYVYFNNASLFSKERFTFPK